MNWYLGEAGKTSPAPSGHSKESAAARSASAHQPMNPVPGSNVLVHPLARMLPKLVEQTQVYRMGEKYPPGLEDGFTPIWEVQTFTLPARQTTQVRVNFQREFHLIAITGLSVNAGGFRFQVYDQRGKRRLADRGVNGQFTGKGANAFFLRDPYKFVTNPHTNQDSQALVIVQNLDTGGTNNIIQLALYGQARRFNFPG